MCLAAERDNGANTGTSGPCGKMTWSRFGRTTLLLAHARSAFRNEALDVANNMPFVAGP